MFASLSSFIPNGLSTDSKFRFSSLIPGNQQNTAATANINSDIEIEDDAKSIATVGDDTALVKKSKDKRQNVNETFIFVRPPPAVNNHPLNLQVQLVPPNSRAPTGISSVTGSVNSRRSVDITNQPSSQSPPPTADSVGASFAAQQHSQDSGFAGGQPLERTASNHSTHSAYSAATSTASFSTVNSTSSTRRTIIPLYNLQAHNVMANVIVDAGTDAKIVKFTKRGMEMISLAVLEPVEVWGAPGQGGVLNANVPEGKLSYDARHLSPNPSAQEHTPVSSHLSLSSAGVEPQAIDFSSPPLTPTPTQNQPQKKRDYFGRIFKRKDLGNNDSSTPTLEKPKPVPNSPYGHVRMPSAPNGKRSSLLVPPSPGPSGSSTSLANPPPQTANPTLGIIPQLSLAPPFSFGVPRTGRPSLYVWVVKKWLKGEHGVASLLSPKRAMMSAPPDPTQTVEVRFEWRKGKSGRKKKSATAPVPVSRSSGGSKEEMERDKEREDRRRRRASASGQSFVTSEDPNSSPSPNQRQLTLSPDDGEESDPEDSETPWSCTLKIRSPKRVSAAAAPVVGKPGGDAPLKVKLGTLSPTPHHPKVVAMLKVPFPLPDVGIDSRSIRARPRPADRWDRSRGRSDELFDRDEDEGVKDTGLMLTAEEIKDVVCATGLWLVVREGFGGVGKVNRKGDGWRIRA